MSDAALRLAGLYDGCASTATGRPYYEDTMRMANAMLSAGVAAIERGSEQDARWPFSVAQSLFSGIMSAADAPADLKEEARQDRGFLQQRLPWLARVTIDPNVMPHPRSPPATPTPVALPTTAPKALTEFDVLEFWTTPFAGTLQTLHVKLNIHPAGDAMLAAADFHIVTFSRSNGRETVSGRSGPAPSYRKPDWTSSTNQYRIVPTVDPSDDLGLQGRLSLHPGYALTRVVTFVVRSDIEVNAETIGSLSWDHR